MEIKETGKILTAVAKPYQMGSNQGISYRIRVLIGGHVYAFSASEPLVAQCRPLEGQDVNLVFALTSPKENLKAELISVSKIAK